MPNLLLQNPSDVGYDLVLLMGQSNMTGTNTDADTARLDTSSGRISTFDYAGTYGQMISAAAEPLTHQNGTTGVGPGMPFARWYADSIPANRKVLLVPAAYQGTAFESGTNRWKITQADDGTNLYRNALRSLKAALGVAGKNARFVAALWLQGENDAGNAVPAATYAADLDALIAQLRTDLALPTLPFIVGQMLPEHIDSDTNWAAINGAHAATPTRTAYTAFAASPYGMNLSADNLHFSARGQRIIGRNMFEMLALARANTAAGGATYTAPGQVTNVALSGAIGQTSAALSWTAASTATSYRVEYKASSSGTWLPGPGSPGLTGTVSGLTAGTSYDFRVTARNAGGNGTASSTLTVSTAASGGGGATPATASDTFTRADNASTLGTSSGGGTWSIAAAKTTSTWGISGNKAYEPSGQAGGQAVIDTGGTDQRVSATYNGDLNLTPVVRSDVNGNTGYIVNFGSSAGSSGSFYKLVAGTPTQIGSFTNSVVAGDTVELSVIGSTLTIKRNGTVMGSMTDTSITTGTYCGLRANQASSTCKVGSFTVANT